MILQANQVFEFGSFRLDPAERILSRDGEPIPISVKAFDTLVFMVQKSGRLIEKSELIAEIWPDSFVEEGNLKVVICALRKALETEADGPKYIQTVAKHGYRFVGEVREVPKSESKHPHVNPATVTRILSGGETRAGWVVKTAVLTGVLLGFAGILILLEKPIPSSVEATKISSLAVLPFEPLNLSPDKKYLGLGMADAIITRLGSAGQIVVRPTSSVAKFALSSGDPSAVGRELKVDAVLEGKIEILPDQVRARIQLVRSRDGFLLWADTFAEPPDQIFALEEDVADRVAGSVPGHVSGQAGTSLARSETKDSNAYPLYLNGIYLLNKRTPDSVRQSIDYFQQAIARDQSYAPSYADLAVAYVTLGSYGEKPAQLYPHAEDAAAKAIDLDNSLAAAHAALAQESFHYGWNWVEADKQFQSAIRLAPNDAMTHSWYGLYLAAMGRNKEAVEHGVRAQQLDPVSPAVNASVGRVFYWTRQYGRAIDRFQEVLTLEPQFSNGHTRLGLAYLAQGDQSNALREFQTGQKLSDSGPYLDGLLGYMQARSGKTVEARKVLEDLIRKSQTQYVPAFGIALVYIGLGDHNKALDWLEKAYQERSPDMVYAKIDPLLDSVRSDRRFIELVQKMGM